MKTNRKFINGLAVAAMVFSVATAARAGIFTWSAPTAITTADTTLNQSGTIVGAEVFGNFAKLVTLSNGSVVDFKADNSVASATGAGTQDGAFTTNTTGNASFDAVLSQFNYDGGPKTITLNNLVVGQQYAVQLLALDDRSPGAGARHANFQDPADGTDISATFTMGANEYVIGTFTAAATTASIQENLPDGGGNINALVIRAIGTNIPPQITTQPQPATIFHGLTATLTAAASGTGPLSYQWQKGSVGGSLFTNLVNGGKISGATNNALTITNLAASDTADYQVVVTSVYGSVTSSPAATLTVLAGTPQFVWSAPAPITTADATLNLTGTVVGAAVFGTTPLVVTLTNGATIDFKTDGSAAALTAGGFGTANGAFSGNTSNANFNAVLSQFTWDGGPHVITLNNLFVGQQYAVQLFALDDRGGLSSAIAANYQDPADSYNVSTTFAMGDNVYTIGTFTASNTTVSIQQNLFFNNSGNINALVVRALGVIVAPQISTQPQSVTIDQGVGTPVRFTAAASGTAPLTYRWQRGAVGSGIFTNVPANARYVGLTSPTLIISNAVVADAADYQIIAANASGSATSAPPATLTVQAITPQFVFSPPAAITTADAALAQSGTIVGAEVFGPSPKIVVLANGTSVDFKNDGSVASATGEGTFTGAFNGNTGNASFNAVLNQASYEIFLNPVKTITLTNLVAGQQYAAQLFALDDRNGTGGRTVNFADPADQYDYSSTFAMPDNVYTIATFTANGTTADIQENLFGGGGNINAIVLRRLTGLPLAPQITTEPQSALLVPAGSTIQFTVGANGTALNYQWQRAGVGSSTFINVGDANAFGATTAQLTISNATAGNMADYRVIVSNGGGSVTSSPAATLDVVSAAVTLLHRWSFSETSGTTAVDSIGGANGTLQGSAAFTGAGYVNLPNPGSNPQTGNSYVQIPGGLLNSLGAVTVECWVTNNGWNNGNTLVGFSGPIDGNSFGTNYINFYTRMFSSISAFEIATTAGDSGLANLGTRVNDNGVASGKPSHYVYIYDPVVSHSITLYTNGVLAGSQTGITIPLSSLGTAVGTIGLSVYNQSQSYILPQNGGNKINCPYLNGGVSEVRIYSSVLSSNMIAADFQLGPDQLPPPTTTTNKPTVNVSHGAGTLSLSWPTSNGGFYVESSPVLGPSAVWTLVHGSQSVAGSNYQMTLPTTNGAAQFFRLHQ